MGEMADWLSGQGFDSNIDGEDVPLYEWEPKSCRYCGKPGLEWTKTRAGWRLWEPHDSRTVHVCLVAPAPEHRNE